MIAVLFSFEQKCFHIEYMHEYIKSNLVATIKRQDHQYRLIAIANSWNEANSLCDQFEKKEPFKSIIAC